MHSTQTLQTPRMAGHPRSDGMAPRAQNDAARGIGKNASTTLLLVLFDREIVLVLVLILGLGLCTRTSSPRPFLA